jgi:diguanylate cyclase (GGDEF)-like protein
LLIDAFQSTTKVVGREIRNRCGRDSQSVSTLAEAQAVLTREDEEFIAAVVALELSDAKGTESAELTIRFGLPTIVLTSNWTPELRRRIWELDVFDYFVKGRSGLEGVCRAIDRLAKNVHTKVLVVDDSSTYRNIQSRLLHAHHFDVALAAGGHEALAFVKDNPDVLLVVTDYEMPVMNGVELVHRLREKRGPDDLAILAVSGAAMAGTSVEFLKHGASDYIPKQFEKEEFYCRVYNSLAMVENTRAIKRAAYTDALTGLHNRLYFFAHAPAAFAAAGAQNASVAVVMMDVDFFKKVNDTHGHAAGDVVLCHVSHLAQSVFGQHMLLSRFGGEEFCAFGHGLPQGLAEALCEELRATLQARPVSYQGKTIAVTMSLGLTLSADKDLDATINVADTLLYQAKHDGRNRVVVGGGQARPL